MRIAYRFALVTVAVGILSVGQIPFSSVAFAEGNGKLAQPLGTTTIGSGSVAASVPNVRAGSTGHTIVFTYVPSQGLDNGIVTIKVPDGWSAPSTIGTDEGFTTANLGAVTVSSQTIVVSGVTMAGGSKLKVTYGDIGAGGPGAAAPRILATQVWQVQQQPTVDASPSDVSPSPSIKVALLFPPFHTDKNAIKDSFGNIVFLRGIEREGTTWNNFPSAFELAQIRAWGANVVRVPLSESLWLNTCTSTSPSNDTKYPGKVDTEVSTITASGMMVLLELNFNVTKVCDKPVAQAMPDTLFSPTFWQQVAGRYKSNPLVAFDLYNEPHNVNDTQWLRGGPVVWGSTTMQAVGMQQLYDTVRGTGASNLIFVAGKNWAATPSGQPVVGTDIVNSLHVYSADPNQVLTQWDALGKSAPVMNTEFGSNNYGGSGTYNASVISACEQRGWGWVAYSFDGGPNGPYDLITDTTTYNPAPSGVPVESGLALN